MPTNRYHVAILGSGLGGAMLACILARHGVSTLLLDGAAHPRPAVGESLTPETGIRLRILGEKYGVPEIGWLGAFHALRDNVSRNCGVNRSFSYLFHSPGQPHRPGQISHLPALPPPFGPDAHLFRPDTDAHLAALSVRYGATLRQRIRIEDIRFRRDHVELCAAGGEVFRAAFLVDAAGMRSMVAGMLGLRDRRPRFRTDTRVLYTHMLGVPPADLVLDRPGRRDLPAPLGQASVHHVFAGGWVWVIPFNNHRTATNPLTSVGLVLDRRRHPSPQGTPEREFRRIIAGFPTVARQFAEATAVRPWVRTGRVQYSSPHLLAPRVLQLPDAAGFVDPLYSGGMSVLAVAIDLAAGVLLAATADNDYAMERFQPVEDAVTAGFDLYDTLVARSLDAFASYDLWNAWNRTWAMGSLLGALGPLALLLRYRKTKDPAHLAKTTAAVLGSHLPEFQGVLGAAQAWVDAAVAGHIPHAEASRYVFATLGACHFLPPALGFGDPARRATATVTLRSGVRHATWYRRRTSPKWQDAFAFPRTTYLRAALGFAAGATGGAVHRAGAGLRDALVPARGDWPDVAPLPRAPGLAPVAELLPGYAPAAPVVDLPRAAGRKAA